MHQPVHILIVDDEPQVRTLLRGRFEKEGFLVSEAADRAEALQRLEVRSGTPSISLITLDLTLGAEDGLALAREIRAHRNVPIIIISGKGDEVDRIVGLELGADDYVTKPFSPREVVARVRAVLRRYEPTPQPSSSDATAKKSQVTFEGGTLDLSSRDFHNSAGDGVDLTTAEFNLLAMFLDRPQRVLSRDEIMTLLKGHDWSPLDRSIDTLIVRLRKKIEPNPDRPQFVKTVRGVGYVFSSSVQRG